jgi:hypothetical protein
MDRNAVIAALEANLRHVERVAARLDATTASTRPADGRWSPLETLEHLVVVERGVHRAITMASGMEPGTLRTRAMDAVVAGAGTVRQPLTAPEMVAPTGRFGSLYDTLQVFRERRTTTLDLARTLDVAWDAHHASHPLLGPLDIGQWLLLAATHAERHIPQLEG